MTQPQITSAPPARETAATSGLRGPSAASRRVIAGVVGWAGWLLSLGCVLPSPTLEAAERTEAVIPTEAVISTETVVLSEAMALGETVGEVDLGPHLEILEDRSTFWTFEDVTSPALRDQFQPNRQGTPNFGFSSSAYWVRFRVENRSRQGGWRLVLHSPSMNQVAIYRPTSDGGHAVYETGNLLPFASREIPHRQFQFDLPSLEPTAPAVSQVQTFYLRFESEAAMILPLKLWARRDLERQGQLESLGLGLFYGFMLALIGYNLLLFLSLRDASYFYHVLHLTVAMACLLAFDGLGQQFFWPRDWNWDPRAVLLFLAATCGAAVKFTSTLLRTSILAPRAHRAMEVTTWAAVGLMALVFALPYGVLAEPLILFQVLSYGLILAVSWAVWRGGYRPARFLLAAWLTFSVSVPILVMLTRVVPWLSPVWVDIGIRLGTNGFVLFFSLALADRIHIMREEKARAQAELLSEQQGALDLKSELNAVLEASKAELEARNAELERYTYTVSHDLKAPIVTIKGFLGLLERDLDRGHRERAAEHIQRVFGAADKMARLLDELLEMSRIGRVMGRPEAIDLSELAQEAAGLTVGPASEHAVAFDIQPQMPIVSGDRTRLLEVFQNLLENAVKFTRHQVSPKIEVRARQQGDEVMCSVRDNGVGIDPAYHETVFGLFDQLDPNDGGTGIGLALVRRIVEVHGGRIWVESEGEGQGSTFSFTLPLHVD
ncbi:MAG: 7TM-DISM domain-containing protein [Acidobacteriota bacterium]